MSIRKIDRTSTLDPGQGEAIGREDAEAEGPGIGRDGEHGQNLAAREVQSDKEEKDIELNKEENEDQVPAAPPPTSADAANAKKVFGMKRSNPTVKKGEKTIPNPFPCVSHQFLTRQ